MSLKDIDKTRDIRTDDELRALVEAIHTSPANTQEAHWIEWKRTLDLSTREDQFKVAKAILGFSNRSVEHAKLACEGVAYMVVGVEPGNAEGVGEYDHAALGQALQRYVDRPRWTLHQFEYAGVTVLVVMVEAPRPGDTIHTLQKEFSNDKTRHYAGTVFHRGTAHTEPAGPKEVEMLCDRLLSGARPDLVLDMLPPLNP
jgi:Putative DNA-binding domain